MTTYEFVDPKPMAHQLRGLRKIIDNEGIAGLLWEPGLGKTRTVIDYAGMLAEAKGGALVLVFAPKSVIDTWPDEVDTWLPQRIERKVVVLEGRVLDKVEQIKQEAANHDVAVEMGWSGVTMLVTNHDVLSHANKVKGTKTVTTRGKMIDAIRAAEFDLSIVDECVAEGTLISTPAGQRPIEELKVGDEVLAYDHLREKVVTDTVKDTFRKRTWMPAEKVCGVEMTPHHPVWTEENGYVLAGLLSSSDTVVSIDPREEDGQATDTDLRVRVVRHRADQAVEQQEQATPVLRSELFREVAYAAARSAPEYAREDVREPRVVEDTVREDEGAATGPRVPRGATGVPPLGSQPVPRSRGEGEIDPRQQGEGLEAPRRGQRDRSDQGRTTVVGSTGLAESSTGNGGGWGVARSLRAGRSGHTPQDWGGVRREIAPDHEGEEGRPPQGRKALGHWLESVALYQRRSDGGDQQSAGADTGGRVVCNITTSLGNYFANGLLTHNSHRAKGRSSNLSRALRSLSRDLPRRIILTGTVAPHSPLDIWAQWAFLNPDRFGTRFLDFRDRYAVMGGWMGKEVTAFRHLDELRDRMAADATVVRREEALDLPPVTERVVPVTLDAAERRAYDQMKQSLVLAVPTDPTGQPIIAPTAVVQWLRLRQLTSGHVGDADGETNIIGSSKVDTATDLLVDLTEADEKVVVFAHFRPDVARTAAAARKRLGDGVPVWEISGDTSTDRRREIRKAFKQQQGAAVVVAQMRTVSLGINEFIVAAHGIFLSMSERRDDWVQAKDRLDRNGQTRPVTLHYLVVPKSIDQVVLDTHRTKGRLERAITEMVREELDQRA